jgi:hypothetical protein
MNRGLHLPFYLKVAFGYRNMATSIQPLAGAMMNIHFLGDRYKINDNKRIYCHDALFSSV